METKKKIVIVGATSAIAEHCARLWVIDQVVHLTLVGRSATRTERVAADLRVRGPHSDIQVLEADFVEPMAIQELVDQIVHGGRVDTVLIAHGSLPNQFTCQDDLVACRQALDVNGISTVLFAEAFAGHMEKASHGTLAVIGSVAGDRGRKSNYIYGAAKGLVTRYIQGLQHRLAQTRVKIVLIKPGPTDTPMTAHLKDQDVNLASVADVAQQIVNAIASGRNVAYVPGKWKMIMWVIRHLPTTIFNRMDI